MLLALSMTWLFVRISPDDESTMPVPAASPCPPASVVLTTATAGSTDDSMAPVFRFPEPPEVWAPAPVVAKPTRPAPTTNAARPASPRDKRREGAPERSERVLVMASILASEPLTPLRND
jgi:hypothetical protein